jgi:hypothetical protein
MLHFFTGYIASSSSKTDLITFTFASFIFSFLEALLGLPFFNFSVVKAYLLGHTDPPRILILRLTQVNSWSSSLSSSSSSSAYESSSPCSSSSGHSNSFSSVSGLTGFGAASSTPTTVPTSVSSAVVAWAS